MTKRNKVTKESVPEGFTLSLAAVDAVPVVFFGINCFIIGMKFQSVLFMAGALMCLFGGSCKVIWKIIVSVCSKNIYPLFLQMRIWMPAGFLLMVISVLSRGTSVFSGLMHSICSFPSALFFAAGAAGMILMGVFAVKLDNADVKSNWIEQITNGLSQIAVFAGLMFL